MGLRTEQGNRISKQFFAKILRNPIYAGWIAYKPLGERYKGDFQPLVTQELFDQVQRRLSGNPTTGIGRRKGQQDFPLEAFRALRTLWQARDRRLGTRSLGEPLRVLLLPRKVFRCHHSQSDARGTIRRTAAPAGSLTGVAGAAQADDPEHLARRSSAKCQTYARASKCESRRCARGSAGSTRRSSMNRASTGPRTKNSRQATRRTDSRGVGAIRGASRAVRHRQRARQGHQRLEQRKCSLDRCVARGLDAAPGGSLPAGARVGWRRISNPGYVLVLLPLDAGRGLRTRSASD